MGVARIWLVLKPDNLSQELSKERSGSMLNNSFLSYTLMRLTVFPVEATNPDMLKLFTGIRISLSVFSSFFTFE